MPDTSASSQAVFLGPRSPEASKALQRLSEEHFMDRLWAQDASLWGADPSAQNAIRERLGWLTILPAMTRNAAALRRFADELRQAGFTRSVLLGMGGSSLFTEVCGAVFGPADGYLPVAVIDTTDPSAIRRHESQDALERLCVIAASKSGTTTEMRALLRHFYGALKRVSRNPGAQCLAITDCDTPLEHEAESLRFRRVFTHGCGTGVEVGGRFSALTFFGLVPAALMGLDVNKLLQRAEAMQSQCAPSAPAAENPALQLGAALGALASAGRNKLTLLASTETEGIGPWIEQLVAESTGKQGKGIVPVHGEARRGASDYGPDRVFVELQTAQRVDAGLDALVQQLIAAEQPVIRIRWQDSYDTGGEAMKWFIATAVVGQLLGVNPLDEPDVQASKDHTQAVLRQFQRDAVWPDGHLIAADNCVALYLGDSSGASPPAVGGGTGTGIVGAGAVKQALAAFFRPRTIGDYLALLSFLPRVTSVDRRLHELRDRLSARLGCATLLQFGPRYLHSTGQLFKGGTSEGRFLLLTADEADDLPIPGESYTFGQLKRAQALGDAAAMQQKGRRILRLHLRGNLDDALEHVARTLDQAVAS